MLHTNTSYFLQKDLQRQVTRPLNTSFLFSRKISGLLHSPIGRFWYSYFPKGSTIVHSFLEKGHNLM